MINMSRFIALCAFTLTTVAAHAGPAAQAPTDPTDLAFPGGGVSLAPAGSDRAKAKAIADNANVGLQARVAVAAGTATPEQQALVSAEQTAAGFHTVSEALSWIGVPRYKIGGNDLMREIDGPSFAARVYERAGLVNPAGPGADSQSPRGAIVHWKTGGPLTVGAREISLPSPPALDALRPGDLLTLRISSAKGTLDTARTDGIYIGRYQAIEHAYAIASPARGTVVVENLQDPENWSKYLYALRPAGAAYVSAVAADVLPSAQAWEPGGKLFIVAAGVSDYRDDAIRLKAPAANARHFIQNLANDRAFGERVAVSQSRALAGKPTKGEILSALGEVGVQTAPNDILFFYFGGHGVPGALLAGDFRPTPPEGQISWDDLVNKLLEAPAKRIVLAVDSANVSPSPAVWARLAGSGKQVLLWSASAKNERVYEDNFGADGPSGVFTYYLIRGLKGNAADASGNITIEQLSRYVREHVQEATQDLQTPVFIASGAGDQAVLVSRGSVPHGAVSESRP